MNEKWRSVEQTSILIDEIGILFLTNLRLVVSLLQTLHAQKITESLGYVWLCLAKAHQY